MPSDDDSELSTDPGPTVTAFHRLYVEMLEDEPRADLEQRIEQRVRDVGIDDAMRILAESPVSPLLKLHTVASLVKRRPTVAKQKAPLLETVVRTTLEAPPPIEITVIGDHIRQLADLWAERRGGTPDDVSGQMANGFADAGPDAAAGTDTVSATQSLLPRDWQEFKEVVLAGFPTTIPDRVMKPGCRDDEVVAVDGEDTPVIVSRFWTDLALPALANYVNPTQWQAHGDGFWLEMTCVDGPRRTRRGYQGVFREVVSLPTGPLTAYLDVTFDRTDQAIWTRFVEASGDRPDQEVETDRGYVFVTTETTAPSTMAQPVLVYATKAITFKDDALNGYADLACDCGWVQLMINMAMDAAGSSTGPGVTPGSQGDPAEPADPTAAWAVDAHELVDQVAQIGHEAPEVAATGQGLMSFADEVLAVYDLATQATLVGARAWRDAVERFASRASGR